MALPSELSLSEAHAYETAGGSAEAHYPPAGQRFTLKA